MIRHWFRTRRALIADLDLQRGITVFDRKEIEELKAENDQVWKDGLAEVHRVQRQRDSLRRELGEQIRQQAATIAAMTAELRALLGDIRREEQADQRPVTFRWPERIDDVLAQEVDMKRRLDGLGDE